MIYYLILLLILLFNSTVEAQKLTLTWQHNVEPAHIPYLFGIPVERKTGTGSFFEVASVPPEARTWIDSNVLTDSEYTYRLRASYAGCCLCVGPGPCYTEYSNEASGKVTSGVPNSVIRLTYKQYTYITPPGMVISLALDEGVGTITHESVSNTKRSITTPTSWILGHTLNGLSFNTGSTVDTLLKTHASRRTYTMWIKRDRVIVGNRGRIFDKHINSLLATESELFYNDEATLNYKYFNVWSSGSNTWVFPQPSINVWHHIAIITDTTTITSKPLIYVDGNLQAITRISTAASPGTLITNTDSYYIGNRGSGDRPFPGSIDDMHIYDRALTPTEIVTDMRGGL